MPPKGEECSLEGYTGFGEQSAGGKGLRNRGLDADDDPLARIHLLHECRGDGPDQSTPVDLLDAGNVSSGDFERAEGSGLSTSYRPGELSEHVLPWILLVYHVFAAIEIGHRGVAAVGPRNGGPFSLKLRNRIARSGTGVRDSSGNLRSTFGAHAQASCIKALDVVRSVQLCLNLFWVSRLSWARRCQVEHIHYLVCKGVAER
jgi:hypothetical protein